METELQLITDSDGVAIIGDELAIEQLLTSSGLESRAIEMRRLARVAGTASEATQVGAEIAANSGRWVKLTESSAKALKVSTPMKGSEPGVARAVLTRNGRTTHILEFIQKPGALLTNPAFLAGAAGIMAQLAMQQTMAEITTYLRIIDEKCDDILRAQKDAVLADMIGVGIVLDEAMTIREQVGHVSDVTWSKVQGSSQIIAKTQAYALRQLDAIVEKTAKASSVGDLAKATRGIETTAREWLVVLARCFQLSDAIAVLELDRVLADSPDDIDAHRRALRLTRDQRLDAISTSTSRIVESLLEVVTKANDKYTKSLQPNASGRAARAGIGTIQAIDDFHVHLGIEATSSSLEARRWWDAVADSRDDLLVSGTEFATVTKRSVRRATRQAKSTVGRLAGDVASRLGRHKDDEADEQDR